jgi:hypothetical protein
MRLASYKELLERVKNYYKVAAAILRIGNREIIYIVSIVTKLSKNLRV